MVLSEFEALLKQTMGLDAVSIGSSSIERAIQQRLAACELKDLSSYWDLLRASELELQELIEAVVVSETWFFRDKEAFAALGRLAHEEWLPTHPEGTMRLLSIPCSTGEEPYTMAMALLDAGFPKERFEIDAVDISAPVLKKAERGLYGRNSFRGKHLDFRDRYFEAAPDGYRLVESIRQRVNFRQGNMLEDGFLPGQGIYDFILCRNLLIYFDRPTQSRGLQVLDRLLATPGFLFVGPVETGLLQNLDFVSVKLPFSFAFRKGRPLASPPRTPPQSKTVQRPKPRLGAVPGSARPPLQRPPLAHSPKPSTGPPIEKKLALDGAASLANQGHLDEAAAICQEHLRQQGDSAQAFYLLGLIRDTAGAPEEARTYYRKALYLEPDHHETLLHLALLTRQLGDVAGAQVLQNRARRVEQRSKS